MEFATQIGKLPYSWRIAGGILSEDGTSATAQIEIADADGIVHPVPDANNNPSATFSVEISFNDSVDDQALIAAAVSLMRNRLWKIEAGNAEGAFRQVIAQNYRSPL